MADNNQDLNLANNGKEDVNNNVEEDQLCRICLEPMTEISLTDTCFHPFCFECLRQWSLTHDICPFCRRVFNNILANYSSATRFRVIAVTPQFHIPYRDFDESLVVIQDLIHQIRDLEHYSNTLQQMIIRALIALNQIDPNSIEYIENLQMIENTEQLIEENRQTIAMILHDLRNTVLRRLQAQQNLNNRQNEELPDTDPPPIDLRVESLESIQIIGNPNEDNQDQYEEEVDLREEAEIGIEEGVGPNSFDFDERAFEVLNDPMEAEDIDLSDNSSTEEEDNQ